MSPASYSRSASTRNRRAVSTCSVANILIEYFNAGEWSPLWMPFLSGLKDSLAAE